MELNKTNSGAEFSEDRKHRYALWRIWDESKPLVMFIGLNPSTANETDNDPTIKSVCRIAANNGYGGVYMMNLFSYVSTDPKQLVVCNDNFLNDSWLVNVRKSCKDVVFAWGNFQEAERRAFVMNGYFPDAMALHINKNGSPKHPLYCSSKTTFVKYASADVNT